MVIGARRRRRGGGKARAPRGRPRTFGRWLVGRVVGVVGLPVHDGRREQLT